MSQDLISTSDFTVDPQTGVGYISQRKAAELLGIDPKSVRNWLGQSSLKNAELFGENNNLTEEGFELVLTQALRANKPKAALFAASIVKAGIRAFIYHEAHYDPTPKPTPPSAEEMFARAMTAILPWEVLVRGGIAGEYDAKRALKRLRSRPERLDEILPFPLATEEGACFLLFYLANLDSLNDNRHMFIRLFRELMDGAIPIHGGLPSGATLVLKLPEVRRLRLS